MMKTYEHLGTKFDKYHSREHKSEIFLRYTLLMDLMKVVQIYGRTPEYNFEQDEKLSKILNGRFGCNEKVHQKDV